MTSKIDRKFVDLNKFTGMAADWKDQKKKWVGHCAGSTGKWRRIFKAIETAVDVYNNRKQKIATSKLNEAMLDIIKNNPPPAIKGKYIKIKYCMQLPSPTPQFVFFANLPQYVKDPYKRFVENKLREIYDLQGVPITIYFRQK